jgi:hypothetical protein
MWKNPYLRSSRKQNYIGLTYTCVLFRLYHGEKQMPTDKKRKLYSPHPFKIGYKLTGLSSALFTAGSGKPAIVPAAAAIIILQKRQYFWGKIFSGFLIFIMSF